MSLARLPLPDPGTPDLRSALRLPALDRARPVAHARRSASSGASSGWSRRPPCRRRSAPGCRRRPRATSGGVAARRGVLAGARRRAGRRRRPAPPHGRHQLDHRREPHAAARRTARGAPRLATCARDVATGEVVAVTSSATSRRSAARFDVLRPVRRRGRRLLRRRRDPARGPRCCSGSSCWSASRCSASRSARCSRRSSGASRPSAQSSAGPPSWRPTPSPGLRVLRGIGGEELFLRRFHAASQEVRAAAVAGRPGPLAARRAAGRRCRASSSCAVTWIGARLVLAGTLDVGQLVAFYGYSAFLLIPLRTFTEAAQRWTARTSLPAASSRVLRLERGDVADPADADARSIDAAGAALHDPASGLTVRPGSSPRSSARSRPWPTRSRCASRASATAAADVRLDGVPLARSRASEHPRRGAHAGQGPGAAVGHARRSCSTCRARDACASQDAVEAASAYDVLDALVDGRPDVVRPHAGADHRARAVPVRRSAAAARPGAVAGRRPARARARRADQRRRLAHRGPYRAVAAGRSAPGGRRSCSRRRRCMLDRRRQRRARARRPRRGRPAGTATCCTTSPLPRGRDPRGGGRAVRPPEDAVAASDR